MMLEKKGTVSYSAAETKTTTNTANNTYSQQHIQSTTHTVHNTQYNHIAVINPYTTKLGLSQTLSIFNNNNTYISHCTPHRMGVSV